MFETALLFHKCFFINNALESMHQREQDPTLKKLPAEQKRLLYSCLRHSWLIGKYLDLAYPKWKKKKSGFLGVSFIFLALEEQIFGEKPVYHTYKSVDKGLSQARMIWLKAIARSLLDKAPRSKAELYQTLQKDIMADPYLGVILQQHPNFEWPTLFEHPPLWARLNNPAAIDQLPTEDILRKQGCAIQLRTTSSSSKRLFQSGALSYQNISSQKIATLLEHILAHAPSFSPTVIFDTCAAPGGKSLLLLETFSRTQSVQKWYLTDLYADKVESVRSNLQRVFPDYLQKYPGLECLCHDWTLSAPIEKADLILVDAPCSGSGVTRKHPDVLWKSPEENVSTLMESQTKILQNAISALKAGGYLIYLTCSIDQRENDGVIEQVLKNVANSIVIENLSLELGTPTAHGQQIMPDSLHDGLYFSVLKRTL